MAEISCHSISRTSSQSSISSSTSAAESTSRTATPTKSKRTRKRFTQGQLILLEQVFHRTSHPTREEREEVAHRAAMDIKSVTIWFQNKRQIERKVALNNSTNRANVSVPPHALEQYGVLHRFSEHPTDARRRSSNTTRPLGHAASLPNVICPRTSSGFLSLDRIASRAEHPTLTPRTPTKLTRHASINDGDAVWETMPSSPVQSSASPCSPFSRDILDFSTKHSSRAAKRSLEWACAAARLAEKTEKPRDILDEQRLFLSFDSESTTTISDNRTECDDTEVESINESHEAITPDASQSDIDWDETFPSSLSLEHSDVETPASNKHSGEDKEDIMTVAYALCGLSRG